MNTKLVNAAAMVLAAAMEQGKTIPATLAIALDSACLLNSPETAAEHEELRARVAELEATPGTVFRASHDSIVMGLYTTREAAQAHCEAKVRQEEPEGSIQHLSWSADDIGPDAEYELHITPAETGGLIRGTGYVVTPLDVAASYDEEADE
ncbi:hypothetical protein ACFZCV_20850 [Streptomyces sp. NPDC007920]|uniref:hypothetical protein n=1 Tax=Streptomyces sp. NPDC007920 TaxID=3364794 RepID=UPI0036ED116F